MPKICAAEPAQFDAVEIADFVSLVLGGGEVAAHGLRDRVTYAAHVAFLREKGCLQGVGGLKTPSANHRREVAKGSGTPLDEETFPFELGWVFILPSARGRGFSFPLCQPLVTAAKGRGVFATSRVNNAGMHKTLVKLGFTRVGAQWPSKQSDGDLALFLKRPTPQDGGAPDTAPSPPDVYDGDQKRVSKARDREDNDEAYVISICDEVLRRVASRQTTFDFLRGDPGKRGRGQPLPIDAYYSELQLAVEYHERQHTEPHPFFDKQDRPTVSGVHRGQQRALYDARRRTLLPQHGITLVELSVSDFGHDKRGRLLRQRKEDTAVVTRKLSAWLAEK